MLAAARNPFKFARLLDRLNVQQPQWRRCYSEDEVVRECAAIRYPAMLRARGCTRTRTRTRGRGGALGRHGRD